MDELALIVVVVVVPVVAGMFWYVYTSNSSTMSICYEVEQENDIEFGVDRKSPVIATI